MPKLEGGKKHWYTKVFGIPWPQKDPVPMPPQGDQVVKVDDDAKPSIVIEKIGDIAGTDVHLTIFRDAWRFRFRRDVATDAIFERVFGSGSGGIHVTLETVPAVHCYFDGDNDGRDANEKQELARLLKKYVDEFKQKIDTAKQAHDGFVWKDCDDPKQRFEYLFSDVKTDGFARIAEMVGTTCKAHVVYPAQSDSALVWSGNAVHPLQMLQNTHQRQIRDAVRGLGQDAARERESDGLSRFFQFQAVPPAPLGPQDPAHKTIEERMKDVESSLSTVGRYLEVAALPTIMAALVHARDELKAVRGAFFAVPEIPNEADQAKRARKDEQAKRVAAIPALAEMDGKMARVHKAITPVPFTREAAETAQAQLVKAHRDLGDALDGVCSVQNFHSIEPFYLFRLMVKFDLRATAAIPAGLRTRVSAGATGFLHNSGQMSWLFEWLRDKLIELDRRLHTALDGKKGAVTEDWPGGEPAFCFYLKGGRAAKYAQGRGAEGENDWDTNIIINPNLRAGDWYSTFVVVHNEVLRFLSDAKRDLTIAMYDAEHCAKFLAALDEHQASLDKGAKEKREQEEAERKAASSGVIATAKSAASSVLGGVWWIAAKFNLVDAEVSDRDDRLDALADRQADLAPVRPAGIEIQEGEREGCKAELIDIGIPRRDTIEAFAQWMHVCPHVKPADSIPIPDHLYFVAEYALMIREAFANRCISIGKTPKRVMRLLEVLELGELDAPVDREWKHAIPPGTLPVAAPKVGSLDPPRKRMTKFMTAQLFLAYDLRIDAGLTKCFDVLYGSALTAPATKAVYPKPLTDAVVGYEAEEAKKPLAKRTPYEAKHKLLCDTIGYVQWVAQRMDDHFRKERAPYLLENRGDLEKFVSAIYTGSVFALHEELEVKLAVTGAFAARLHAEYGRLEPERFGELEPIRRLDVTVYTRNGAKPEIALELVAPLVKEYIAKGSGNGNIKFTELPIAGDSLCLTLPAEKAFSSEFTYKPLVVKITAMACEDNWPSLSFIRGMPVLNLRDLIWEYKRRAGEIEESFTQESLRIAVDALSDVLTRFENPSPGALPPALPKPVVQQGGAQPPPQQPRPQPQQPQIPLVRRIVPGVVGIGQRESNWCWAATSVMMRSFYLRDTSTLDDVVREAFGELKNFQNALRLQRLKPRGGVERRTLSWPDVQRFVTENKPFVIGNAGHYYVCFGYEERGPDETLVVWDPMGAGKETKIPYATYERGTREQDWATACDFEISLRRELLPITLAAAAVDLNQPDGVGITVPAGVRIVNVSKSHLRVRAEQNVLREVGAVLRKHEFAGVPSDAACSQVATMLLGALRLDVPTTFLLELEVELAEGAVYQPPGGDTRVKITVTPIRS